MKNPSLARLRVLVADPAPHMSTLTASLLRAIGVGDITTATTMFDTGVALRTRRFDAILMLDRDEGWDGLALVGALRRDKDGENRDAPVLLMARAPDERRVKAARDTGVNEILRKPFAAHDLETRLGAMLGTPRRFVDSAKYAGPDRRRRRAGYQGVERRGTH